MINYIIQLIWFFLPAGMANMAAAISRHLPMLNIAVDGGRTMGGQPILGSHKTWRGVFFALLAALVTVYIQKYFNSATLSYNLLDYSRADIWLFGLAQGAGAMLGDLGRSFIKRRLGIMPGQTWFPWDQIDWIVGALLVSSFYVSVDWVMALWALALATLIHPLVNYFCYLLKIQTNKF